MPSSWRALTARLACLGLVLAGFAVLVVLVFASAGGGSSSGSGAGFGVGELVSLRGDPLGLLPAAGVPVSVGVGGSSVSSGGRWAGSRSVGRLRPGVVLAHLGAVAAARVDAEAFPAQVTQPAGGLPSLPRGQRVVRMVSPRVVRVALGHGERGVVEATQPMAIETSRGHLEPVDLALRRVGGAFESARPVVGVLIPSHAGEGVQLPEAGVSLTPVGADGGSLAGSEGRVDGASVLYANTQTAEDTLVKPTTMGFSIDAILRSIESPRQLYYRVKMPNGARLLQGGQDAPARVVSDGRTLGLVMPPTAVDATGASVQVTMSVVGGDMLSLSVQDASGDYKLPISVDPEYDTAGDRSLTGAVWPVESYKGGHCEGTEPARTCPTNWKPFFTSAFSEAGTYKASYGCGTETYWCKQSWYIEPNGEYNGGEFAGLQYKTQGESTVYNLEMWVAGYNEPSQTVTEVEYNYGPAGEGRDNHVLLSGGLNQTAYKDEPLSMTSGYLHNPLETPRNNDVRLMDYTTKHASLYGFWTDVWNARVYVAQEESKHPEAEPTAACPQCGFNTTSPTIAEAANRTNVLYGSGSWLGPNSGAYEVTAHDSGIGVSFVSLSGGGLSEQRFIRNEEGKCLGVQCNQTYSSPATYLPTMAEGEDSIELYAEDAAELHGYSYHTIKVDAKAPEKLEVTGWPERREISSSMHTLTLSARDEGPGGKKSSGVKSIAVSIDGGQETTISGASCPEGPCTGTGTYVLHAEELTEGTHRLVVTATDNASNVAAKEFKFDVRHASPVAVGPGTVDPTTGQFKLGATDVSLGGVTAVSRTYQSRNLTAGSNGPLGPQWALNLGVSQSLVTLPEGAVALTAAGGGRTTFTRNEKGEYESPLGDENIKLEAKEKEPGKGVSEYLIKDAKAGTTSVFTQPVGTEETTPIYANQFGQEGAGFQGPRGVAVDSQGNVWVSDLGTDRIVEFSSAGVLLKAYGTLGEYANQFKYPAGIAINKSTGNIYVADLGNNRVVELSSSGSFVRAFGWGVAPGGERKEEFQNCTSYCQAGIAGAGAGQFTSPSGVAVDSSGNVWVSEGGSSNRVQEFTEKGEYLHSYGSTGSGAGQMNGPVGMVFFGGDLYVVEWKNNRIQELTTSGAFVKVIGWGVNNGEEKLEVCTTSCRAGIAGSGNGEFNAAEGLAVDAAGNLYVTDFNNNRVQELTTAGAFVTKFGSSGPGPGQFSEPTGVAVGLHGEIYAADYANKRVQEWMRPVWLPSRTEDALKNFSSAYAYKPVEEEGTTVIEPTEALAATPAGISCVGEHGEVEERFLKQGCRALTFNYAEATTAKGQGASEWGDYKGDLTRVYFHGFDPASKAMSTRVVAHYLYDSKGRLRAEWDPRTEPKPESEECAKDPVAKGCLATVYGYDEAGHLTAVTPPGQESFGLVYGTIATDSNSGRLLKVTRGKSTAPLWAGEAPRNTEAPKLSGTAAVGVRMAVSNGAWANNPVVYGYQWEDCNAEGKECAAILGATNQNYTPVSGDVGHTLVVVVSAVNGGGSITVASVASTVTSAIQTTEYALPGASVPVVITSGPDGNLWYTDTGSSKIGKITTAGSITEYALPEKSGPWGITSGPDGNLWFADYFTAKIGKSTTAGVITEYALPSGSGPIYVTQGSDGNLWFTDGVKNEIGKITTGGTITEYGLPAASRPEGIVSGPDGNLWFVDFESNKIGKITTGGVISEYALPAGSKPYGIVVGSDKNLWFTDDGTGKVGKITTSGVITEFTLATGSSPVGIASGPEGNLWVAESGTDHLGEITTSGAVTEYPLPNGSAPYGITQGSDKNIWYTDKGSNKIGRVTLKPTEGEARSPQPGSTIEYHLPVSGGGVPQNLSREELERWAQKDDPVEGTAVFPADEPQGWPASGYKRATIDYMDEEGRTVNAVSPGGGVATSEYNEANEVIRTLSPANRAAAMAEGCVSVAKKECKSAETAEKLDSRSEYNLEESEIVRTLGPEHKVKLPGGTEAQARAVTHDYYNEDAAEAEEKNGEEYNLLTRSVSGALLSNGEEKDVRTTLTGYSGQEGLGWKLRQPTSTTVDPAGLDLVSSTRYNKETGAVEETRSPGGNSELVSPPSFSLHFGGAGAGGGQFKEPQAVAVDSAGNVWAVDTGNDRVEKFTASGAFVAAYGGEGSGAGQFKEPTGIAVSQSTGEVFVSDAKNNRVEVLSSTGGFVEAVGWGVSDGKAELEVCERACQAGLAGAGNGELSGPAGITLDSKGDLWVVDSGNDRVQELSAAGAYLGQFGSKGSGNGQLLEPAGVAISEGSLYVVDHGNDRVQQFSTAGAYLGQFGGKGAGNGQLESPFGIAANPTTGVLYVCDDGNERMEEFSPAGKFLTQWQTWAVSHEQIHPRGVAVNSTGDLYIIDHVADVVGEWAPPEAGGAHLSFSTMFGSKGAGNGQLAEPGGVALDGKGNVWVSDYANNRVQEFSGKGAFLAAYGKEGSGEVQFKKPTRLAVNKSTGNVYVTDMSNNRVEELSSTGAYVASFGTSGTGALKEPIGDAIDSQGNVWVADRGNNRIVEFSSTGTYIAAYGKEGSGELQFKAPDGIAFSGENVYVTDSANHRVQEITNKGAFVRTIGLDGSGSSEFFTPEGIAADAAGNLYVSDLNANHIEEFSPTGAFKATYGSQGTSEGHFEHPIGLAVDPAGDLYVVDNGNSRIQLWDNNQQAVHDAKTIYYTATANSEHKECGEHPEWANLTCRAEPAAQPSDAKEGGPSLPVVTMTYNLLDEVETTTEAFGSLTRTKTQTYDAAGRAITSEETSTSSDAALPKVTNEYNAETGALEKQTATIKSEAKTLTAKDNTLGQLVEYKDASGNVAKYVYEEGGDARLLEVSEGDGLEAASKQAYSYNETTGVMSKLVDSAAGTFTAGYDLEGKLTSEVYPNGMCANTSYDSTGAATSVSYIKTRNCSESNPTVWFSDTVVPGVHGETLSQESTLAKNSYAYDAAGRLTETQETPAGKGCATRLYAYDEESNRTSLTSREPGVGGVCATEGGSVQRHLYDEANRLTDEGAEYEALGNTTRLPAADAGGKEIKSSFYVDGQAYAQEQNKTLNNYIYDPTGRTMETLSENTETKAKATVVSHYAGPGGTPTWTSEGAEKWARNIPGIGGGLQATEESAKVVTLQLSDLQGNIVATAADNETETKLLTTYNSTEFGVPTEGKTPPKYAWLGAGGLATETTFGTGVSTQAGACYIPQIARNLQTAPIEPPGAFPNGIGGGTQYTATISTAELASAQATATQIFTEAESARQEAKAREAEEKVREEEGEEPYDPNDPEFRDYKHGVHFNVDARILSMSKKIAVVSFRAFANTPGISHKHVEYLRINVKRFTANGRIENVFHNEIEYKTSLAAMTFDAPVTTDELWIFELVSVVYGTTRDYSIVTKLVEGEIVLWSSPGLVDTFDYAAIA